MLRIIGGKFKNRRIYTCEQKLLRPTAARLRESFFNICQGGIEGTFFLDLFAGSGAVGIEALSRGSIFTCFVEQNRCAADCIRKTVLELEQKEHCKIVQKDALLAVKTMTDSFDIIYMDPPYNYYENNCDYLALILEQISARKLLKKSGLLFIEEAAPSKLELIGPQKSGLILEKSYKSGRSLLHRYSQHTPSS